MTEPQRPTTRALLGTMLLVGFLLVYVFAAMLLAVAVLPSESRVAEFLYYAVAGLAWVPPAGLIIRWMYAPRPAR
ncbi:MAG: DUF2842 domain-containing protein [Hyphomicrobiaceae bacterium]|nr:DUF2842 domain-containing protein [Hyphomicrobiaceae bacterium]